MTIRAVVFDLFGTLVPEFPLSEWDRMFDGMCRELGADVVAFRREWDRSLAERQTGRLGDVAENVRVVCERAGVVPTEDEVARALGVRAGLYRDLFHPQPRAVEALRWLEDHDYATALLSNCAPDTPALWHGSAMDGLIDVLVFSSEVGLRKPDPAIYHLVTERLGEAPGACLFVGDGASRELSGAAAVGMIPVRIVDPAEPDAVLRPDRDDWEGTTVDRLSAIPALRSG